MNGNGNSRENHLPLSSEMKKLQHKCEKLFSIFIEHKIFRAFKDGKAF